MVNKSHPDAYLLASAAAATINYPLWKASAIAQSGFVMQGSGRGGILSKYVNAMMPPYRGVPAVIIGMTWARASIFYGSDRGRVALERWGAPEWAAVSLPPVLLSGTVQFVNMPIVRASITMQNPATESDPRLRTTWSTIRWLAQEKTVMGLWHGLSAGIAKTVPKYVTSVVVKDVMEDTLPLPDDPDSEMMFLARAAIKSVVAGVAGAALTNPMDVVRNEMFKTDRGMRETIKLLDQAHPGGRWLVRGLSANLVAVSIPITVTIFLTDVLVRLKG